jgi:rubredoxin
MGKYECIVCGYICDQADGDIDNVNEVKNEHI